MIAVGQTIGNYTITSKLGEGGMGVVYLAEHPVIGRKVALKAIHPELSRNPEVVSRFITEAKAVNQIGNEHIVDIHDFGNTAEGEFYFIMEYLQGESLADRLRREGVMTLSRSLQIAAQVADALAASHAHGIIHRDLKPENIFLINRGQSVDFVKVLDFGLAKLIQGEEKVTHKTRTGSVMGTPYYMAPEQCEGRSALDQRADLYSLGVILFEMLTGRVPFTGDGYGEIIVKHITMAPPSPRSLNPELGPALESILLRALAKDRNDRFASMPDLRAAILDPDAYLAAAPPAPAGARGTPAPQTVRDDEVSGQVVFGAAGERQASLPSTFRHGVGELFDDETEVRKSRKGLVITLVVAAGVAAGGAFFVFNGRQAPAARATAAVAPSPPPTAVPPAPRETVIKFDSRPEGAVVTRQDIKQAVGTTPFEYTVPVGKDQIEFTFQKPGFEDSTVSIVPEEPKAALSAILIAQRPPAAEPEPAAHPVAGPLHPATARPRPSASHPTHRPPARPVNDEDGVLEPSFK